MDIEQLAIRAAKGNNGGEWATHYTEEQKEHWRQLVRDLVIDAAAEQPALHGEVLAELQRLRTMIKTNRATYAGYDADRERSGKQIEELSSALAATAQALAHSFHDIERLRAAIRWTREVHPGKNPESGGAIVNMTWEEFHAMRALADDGDCGGKVDRSGDASCLQPLGKT